VAELNDDIKALLPGTVFREISQHLRHAGSAAEEGFPSGEEEEDALSGDMLRALRHRWSPYVDGPGTQWRWCVTTRKFRGRGELATERLIGADGIIQIEITPPVGEVFRKGLLFQAKKNWRHRDGILVKQVQLMESVAPGGTAVFNYESERYTGASSVEVISADGNPRILHLERLGQFLAGDFLNCLVGRQDTYYDWNIKGLVLAGMKPGLVRMHPKFLASIQVESIQS
jgi:hypothetical protein